MTDREELQSATTMNLHTAVKFQGRQEDGGEGTGCASSYLSVPTGALLDIDGETSDFVVGQWTCLKAPPQGEQKLYMFILRDNGYQSNVF